MSAPQTSSIYVGVCKLEAMLEGLQNSTFPELRLWSVVNSTPQSPRTSREMAQLVARVTGVSAGSVWVVVVWLMVGVVEGLEVL